MGLFRRQLHRLYRRRKSPREPRNEIEMAFEGPGAGLILAKETETVRKSSAGGVISPKEMWKCLSAQDLIRQTMLQSAQEAGVLPHAIKRRPKEHALLTKPRARARAERLMEKPP